MRMTECAELFFWGCSAASSNCKARGQGWPLEWLLNEAAWIVWLVATWLRCLVRYPGTEKNTLEDISLFCTLNSRVAVLGPNGAGKSTMIKVRAHVLFYAMWLSLMHVSVLLCCSCC